MPFSCSAFNCCGNYDKGPKVSVFKTRLIHKFPLNIPKLKPDAVPPSILGVLQYLRLSSSNARMSPESKKMRMEIASINKAVADSSKTKYFYDEARHFLNLKELSMYLRK
ncbi:uncharacterized protein [Parasteatoda tepidariorum]|uniref:uncharacterized protein n=1 Tax=Parasteatoda tepidariorum TaxID=114398 RepID=UPI0039BC87E6